ncbi:MAG: 2,3-bisphosphoglycerate-independent phosphoglycerate mutase [Coriobacteriia bacterium]|nr:2,3-bisphosphoglycerate-independent phosphoglycerate mutase [Coriobacteriia bacterium]
MSRNLPALLVIMDGFGLAQAGPSNAISLAHTPRLDELFARYPTSSLRASGIAVGLPEGQMGNSEVGHLNIGAGRVVYQELTRICRAIEDGSLQDNEVLAKAIDAAVAGGGALHLMGLLSDGGVHSHRDHLYALVRMAKSRGASRIFIHCFLDGRDVPPRSGLGFVADLQDFLDDVGVGAIATVMGRYWAMDRDNRWDRVEKAWRAMVLGQGMHCVDACEGVSASYSSDVTDEFVEPLVVTRANEPVARVEDRDSVVFFNFRPDRAREITRAFVDGDFDRFVRPMRPDVHFACLTEYDPTLRVPVAFPKDIPCCVLADVLAEAGLRQLHIAETEKYAHVTFFLNGGLETPNSGEERILVPSPKVPTYDLQPEMSAPDVAARLVEAIEAGRADVYIVNFANCDMVGHTGVLQAAISAVEAVDSVVGQVVDAVRLAGGIAVVTADHGNAERMVAEDGTTPFTAHTPADVPMCVIADGVGSLTDGGILADVSPTLLDLIGIPQPVEWTGRSLLLY